MLTSYILVIRIDFCIELTHNFHKIALYKSVFCFTGF